MKIRKPTSAGPVVAAAAFVLAFSAVPAAVAAKGHGGASSSCTQNAPGVAVQNNMGWNQTGSWGLPGQRLGFQVLVSDTDTGCGSTTFTMTVTAPSGFTVSVPTSSFSLRSGSSTYLWAYVTSPDVSADGAYPVTISVTRSGSGAPASAMSASEVTTYDVYSSDSAPPTLWYNNPADGEVLSGSSYTFAVWTKDDHAVQKVELYIDGVYKTTATCTDVSYICALNYKWSLSGEKGTHTATFKAYDWMGNVGSLPVSFTVS
jgi:Big-like domain-containing protein